MLLTNKLENYLSILHIRRGGRRRDSLITGGVFVVSFTLVIALGILDRLTGRSLYLVVAMTLFFAISFLMAWVNLQILKGSIELIDNILLMNEK